MMVSPGAAATSLPFNWKRIASAFIDASRSHSMCASRLAARSFELLRKVPDHAGDGVGRRLPQAADRRIGHRPRQLVQERQIPVFCAISPTAFSVPTRQGVHCPHDSSAKKRIRLSAASRARSRCDSTMTAAEPMKRAVRLQRIEIERNVAERCRQDPARRTARKIAVELVARQHAAAVFVDQLAHGDARGREMHAGLRDAARHRKRAQTLAAVPALTGEPCARPFRECRAPSRAFPCCARASAGRRARLARRTAGAAAASRACLRSTRSSPTLRRRCTRPRRGADGCAATGTADRLPARRSRARGSRGTRRTRRAGRRRCRRCRPPTRRSASLRGSGADRARGSSDP